MKAVTGHGPGFAGDRTMPTDSPWRRVVADVERVRTQRGRAVTGLYSVEGIRLHERAVRSGVLPEQVAISAGMDADPSPRIRDLLGRLRESGCAVSTAPDDVMHDLISGRGLGDIVGLVRKPASASINETMAAHCGDRCVVVVAIDVFDPGNCGALVRTALAGGAALFVATGTTDPYHPRAVQTSMGSLFKLPIAQQESAPAALAELRAAGSQLVGMSCSGSTELPDAEFSSGRVAVVLGSESFGLPQDVLESLDLAVRIPMPAGVDSFSVNAAAAIVLYELGRTTPAEAAAAPS